MILTDAGPLVALARADDPYHDICASAIADLEPPFLTTAPAFGEAMYLLARYGWRAQDRLWVLWMRQDLIIAELDRQAMTRARHLMNRYRDLPMDLADATLVALAEQRGTTRVFTLDADFRIYRLNGRTPFQIVPDRRP